MRSRNFRPIPILLMNFLMASLAPSAARTPLSTLEPQIDYQRRRRSLRARRDKCDRGGPDGRRPRPHRGPRQVRARRCHADPWAGSPGVGDASPASMSTQASPRGRPVFPFLTAAAGTWQREERLESHHVRVRGYSRIDVLSKASRRIEAIGGGEPDRERHSELQVDQGDTGMEERMVEGRALFSAGSLTTAASVRCEPMPDEVATGTTGRVLAVGQVPGRQVISAAAGVRRFDGDGLDHVHGEPAPTAAITSAWRQGAAAPPA